MSSLFQVGTRKKIDRAKINAKKKIVSICFVLTLKSNPDEIFEKIAKYPVAINDDTPNEQKRRLMKSV